MYNSSDGVSNRQHTGDGVSVRTPGSSGGEVEGDNGECRSDKSQRPAPSVGGAGALAVMREAFGEGWQERFGDEFGKGLLGSPADPNPSDVLGGYASVGDFLKSEEGDSFLYLLAKVMMILAKTSGQSAADERNIKMAQLMNSLKQNLEGAKSLADGAKSAMIAGVVGGVVGLLGAGVGMGGSAMATKFKGQAVDTRKQIDNLTEADVMDLVRVNPHSGVDAATLDASSVLQSEKIRLCSVAEALEKKANTATSVGEGVGRLSSSAGTMSSSASSMVMTTAQAQQATNQAVAAQESQAFGMEDEWQRTLHALKDTILGVVGDAIRAMTQAQSAAFR